MNIHQVLIFCFFSALCGGRFVLVRAKPTIFMGAEGGNGTIDCHLSLSGSWRFFCREECKGDDLLIKTDGNGASSGRYSLQYKLGSGGRGIVSVTITNLTQSDSAKYRCGFGESVAPNSFIDFEVRVSNELDINSGFTKTFLKGENIRYPCLDSANRSTIFLCRGECKKEEDILIETDKSSAQSGRYGIEYIEGSAFGLHVKITEVTTSDAGKYTCGYGKPLSSQTYRTDLIIVVDAVTTSKATPTFQPSTYTATPTLPAQSLSTSSGNNKPSSCFVTTDKITAVLLSMCVTLIVMVIGLSLTVLKFCMKKETTDSGLKSGGDADSVNVEIALYENCDLVSTWKDSTHQGLSSAVKDQGQTCTDSQNRYQNLFEFRSGF